MHRHFFASLCLFWLSFSTIFVHSLFQGLPHTAFDGSGFLSDPLFEGQAALKPAGSPPHSHGKQIHRQIIQDQHRRSFLPEAPLSLPKIPSHSGPQRMRWPEGAVFFLSDEECVSAGKESGDHAEMSGAEGQRAEDKPALQQYVRRNVEHQRRQSPSEQKRRNLSLSHRRDRPQKEKRRHKRSQSLTRQSLRFVLFLKTDIKWFPEPPYTRLPLLS